MNESATLRRQIQADILGLQWILDNTKTTDNEVRILELLTKHKRAMANFQKEVENDPSKPN